MSILGLSTNHAPLFDGTNYTFWCVHEDMYIMSLGCDVYLSLVHGYTIFPPMDANGKKVFENIAKTINVLLRSLTKFEFDKFMHFTLVQEAWDKLFNTYYANEKVRR